MPKYIRVNMLPDLAARLAQRGQDTVTDAAREALERYLALLEIGRAALRARKWEKGQLAALCHLGNGTLWQAHDLGPVSGGGVTNMIAAQAADESAIVLASFTNVAKAPLIRHLNSLSTVEVAALVDALERFWRASSTGLPVDPAHLLDDPPKVA